MEQKSADIWERDTSVVRGESTGLEEGPVSKTTSKSQ